MESILEISASSTKEATAELLEAQIHTKAEEQQTAYNAKADNKETRKAIQRELEMYPISPFNIRRPTQQTQTLIAEFMQTRKRTWENIFLLGSIRRKLTDLKEKFAERKQAELFNMAPPGPSEAITADGLRAAIELTNAPLELLDIATEMEPGLYRYAIQFQVLEHRIKAVTDYYERACDAYEHVLLGVKGTRYKVILNVMEKDGAFTNADLLKSGGGISTPHFCYSGNNVVIGGKTLRASGKACLGNAFGQLANALTRRNENQLILAISMFVQSANLEDSVGAEIVEYDIDYDSPEQQVHINTIGIDESKYSYDCPEEHDEYDDPPEDW